MAVSVAAGCIVDAAAPGADSPTSEYDKPHVGGLRGMVISAATDGAADAAAAAADPPTAE